MSKNVVGSGWSFVPQVGSNHEEVALLSDKAGLIPDSAALDLPPYLLVKP